MAFAVRAKDAQLLVEINRALAQLGESGELQTHLRKRRRALSSPLFGHRPAAGCLLIPGAGSGSEVSYGSAWIPPICPIPVPGTIARV